MERLYISDFYLANPPLLHKTHMPLEIRKEFHALSIVKPEKGFLSFPSPQMLFAKMEPVQKEALRTLVGKGFVAVNALRAGKVVADEKLAQVGDMVVMSSDEHRVVSFLTRAFAGIGAGVPGDLRLATGLRRPGT
ncbi:hypothetical protein FBZ90_11984 [Nitrospirillum pindoramense]|uniref:Uncharacterized protein n=1 Tax=Nitrospirillum amazonense TaxID=28077 RepID=A0A560GQ64_9PROT|nr:hypothetical protein FBZ90_11984 [Nitrospirillum amazonense]